MCTLSIIPIPRGAGAVGLRLVINRDESDQRPAALPPQWIKLRSSVPHARAIWPIDPVGGGTWVAGTSAGLALAILNRNLEPKPILPQGLASRGTIIPLIAHAGTVQDAAQLLRAMNLDQFAPFRLVLSQSDGATVRASVCTWDRRSLTLQETTAPVCVASSGLGDSLVQARLPLFEREVIAARDEDVCAAQDAFHAHQWPEHPERSVLMRRPGYRTVSVTTLEVMGVDVSMTYRAVE